RKKQQDGADSRAVVLREPIQSREGARDDNTIEGLQPGLTEQQVKADGADAEHDEHRRKGVRETAEAEGVVHLRSIVGPWTTKVRSASSTSISTRNRWRASTRTSPTSRSRRTSSRSPLLAST